MSQWTNDEIDAFLREIGMCQEGYDAMNALGNYGLTLDEAAAKLNDSGYPKFAEWVLEQKKTEAYVRFNGKVITMGAYQVFNPLTGVHTRYETEAEAKQALIAIAQDILKQHSPTVVQELSNENGDTVWIATKMNETLVIS
jgi:hypothetical protein